MRVPVAAAAALSMSILCAPLAAQPARDAAVSPLELGKIWDAEHVSPALPPLMDHAEVVRRLESLTAGAGQKIFKVEKIGESIEGRSINAVARRLRSVARAALVADARRRAHRDVGALRSVRVPAQASGRSGRPPDSRRPDAARRADAQPGRGGTLSAAERAEHRRQPRRAASADARGPRAQRPSRSPQSADRIQPAQPGLAHVGGRSAEAGVGVAPLGRVRRSRGPRTQGGR